MKTLDEVLEVMTYGVGLNSKADCWEVPVDLYGVIVHYLHEYKGRKAELEFLKREIKSTNEYIQTKTEERTAKVVDIFCGNCGRALIGNESYCPGCGARLERK